MPGVIEAITFLVISAQAGALGAGLAAVFGTSAFLTTALSVGLSFLSSVLFRPKQPKPEDVQSSVKNPTAARQRHYGRVKTSGPWVFAESSGGELWKLIALGTGELDAIEEYWADDNLVVPDGSGNVGSDPYDNKLRIYSRLGLATETHYANLTSEFPEWTSDHRGDGIASLLAVQEPTKADQISDRFPNLAQTLYRVVARGSKVFNLNPDSPPDSPAALAWTDNAAGVIRDYMSHPDGMRFPEALFSTPLAQAGWVAAYSRCAEAVPLKAGGTEARYRLWGSYTFDERPADVLGRMLASCDGRIIPTPDGGVTLDIGTWEEPTVIIDADTIVGFSDVARGRDIQATANTIRATYLSPFHDYQATDADPWVDEADVSARGEISADKTFNMAPSHGQARRLMKLEAYRAKPNWTGTFQCNLRAMAAFGKRFVRIRYPLFGIDEVCEQIDFRFNIGEGSILQGVTITVFSMPEVAYEWDAATEEGDAPLAEEVTVDRSIPEPDNFTFTEGTVTVSGQSFSVGVVEFDLPPDSLTVQARYKKTSDSAWLVIPIGDGETKGQTGALDDGEEYEAQVRHVTLTGRVGDWTDSEVFTPISNPTPTSAPTLLTATPAGADVNLSAKAPNSPIHKAVHFWRADATTAFGSATDLGAVYGPPNGTATFTDTPGDGTWRYWATAENLSGVQSAEVGPSSTAYIGLEAETTAYITAWSTKPGNAVVLAVDALIAGMKADGVYSIMRWLSLACVPTSQAGLLNVINPAETGAINGTVTFTANSGFSGDGTTGYISTGVMSNAASPMTTNSLHIGGWFNSGSGSTGATTSLVGNSGSVLFLSARSSTSLMSSRANAAANLASTISPTTLAGHRVANRSGASARENYNNGVSVGSDTQAASSLTAVDMWFLRVGALYAAASQPASVFHFGGSLSGANATALHSRLATFRTAMGL